MIISDLAVSRDQGSQTLFRTWVQQTQCLGEKERKKEREKKMRTTKHDARHTGSNFLKHDPALIYSLDSSHTHTASHTCCRQRITASAVSGILDLGTFHGSQHFSPLPG